MHCKIRNTPGEPESFSANKQKEIVSKSNSHIKEEHSLEPSLISILGALAWIALRTRPDTCLA
eukprot:3962848-Prorocentrum_lima.AAC.1